MPDSQTIKIAEALWREAPRLLPEFLRDRRWFAGKARKIRGVEILDVIPISHDETHNFFLLAKVSYEIGQDDLYDIPLVEAQYSPLGSSQISPRLKFHFDGLHRDIEFTDALLNAEFRTLLLVAISENKSYPGINGELRAKAGSSLSDYWKTSQPQLPAVLNRGEQSNSSIFYGDKLILKIFRRLEAGTNPDIEMGTFLTDKTEFRNIASVTGSLEYAQANGEKMSLGILQAFVANRGDAWEFTLQQLRPYFESQPVSLNETEIQPPRSILDLSEAPVPSETRRIIGEYLNWAELLAERTAELHLALSSERSDEVFKPELCAAADQREFTSSAARLLHSTFQLLRDQRSTLPAYLSSQIEKILLHEDELQKHLQDFALSTITAWKSRIHGDYHLGQVLFTGTDFVIIDFEGEPSRPLSERRKKRSPLQDVAGMLRSFDYAANAQLVEDAENTHNLAGAAAYWYTWVSAAFLRKYREVAGQAAFIPKTRDDFELMIDTFLLDKAVYELGYELNNRPTWLQIPLGGISQLIQKVNR